jgi:hypothetical protein
VKNEPLSALYALLSAASRSRNPRVRVMYAAQARVELDAIESEAARVRVQLDALEADLLRVLVAETERRAKAQAP